jgi:hypothetical protein
MVVFNIDENEMISEFAELFEKVGRELSEEKFMEIANKIEDTIPGIIEYLVDETKKMWISEAKNRGGWGRKYIPAIKSEFTGNDGSVYLDERTKDKKSKRPNYMFAMMVEEGVKSWSIKDALLQSERAKVGPSGIKYIIVPFPVRTPRRDPKTKMSSHFQGREMTQEMYRIVKAGGRLKSGKLKTGEDVSGLVKWTTRKYHAAYGFFRCVSEKSTGWKHPGKSPSPVYPLVEKEVSRRIKEVIQGFMKAIVNEYSKK